MSVYLGDKKASKINLITNQNNLPDWDDNSPIIAKGQGVYTSTLWELTERGTLRWQFNPNGSGGGVYTYCAGWNNSITTASQSPDYMKISSKIKQIDVGEGIKTFYMGYAVNCERIRIHGDLTAFSFVSFDSLKEIECSDKTRDLLQYMGCHNIEKIVLTSTKTTLPANFAYGCYNLKDINVDNVKVFNNNCFYECANLAEMIFGENLVEIKNQIFRNARVSSVRFKPLKGEYPVISSSAFQMSILTDIYCPWEEGAVANAPWGATNATIHYNWVEEVTTDAED